MNQIITLNDVQNTKLQIQKNIGADGSIKLDEPVSQTLQEISKKVQVASDNANEVLGISRSISLADLLYVLNVEQNFFVGSVADVKRMNRAKGKILDVNRSIEILNNLVSKISIQVSELFPGYKLETYNSVARALIIILDSQFEIANQTQLVESMLASFEVSGNLNFVLFTCPPTDFSYLDSDYPQGYVQTGMQSSLLAEQIPVLKTLPQFLRIVGINPNLLVLSGDDDGIYLTPLISMPDIDPQNILQTRPNEERAKAISNIEFLLKRGKFNPKKDDLPAFENLRVLSLANTGYMLEGIDLESLFWQIYENSCVQIDRNTGEFVLTEEDFALEAARMRELFGNYYKDIVQLNGRFPTDQELSEIVRLKFALYAIQGVLAASLNPNSVLIQVEKPREVRDRMLNAGLRILGQKPMPSIYI